MEAAAHRLRIDAELAGVRAHVVEGDLCRLLHHVAELTGQRESRLGVGPGRERRRLDEQDVASGAGDGEAGGHAGQLGAIGDVVDELRPSEPLAQLAGRDIGHRLTSGDPGRRLAGEPTELPLQRTHAGFPRVVADHGDDRGVVDVELAGLQPARSSWRGRR